MADYYPLIARAVAGLEKNNGENRRALYERARAALLAQLRSVTPALDETDITRERLALEESIRKAEAESARQFVDPSRPPPPKARPAVSRPWTERRPPPGADGPRPGEPRAREEGDPSRRYVNPPAAAPRADSAPKPRPPTLPDPRQSNSIFDRPLASEAQALRQPPPRPAGEPRP